MRFASLGLPPLVLFCSIVAFQGCGKDKPAACTPGSTRSCLCGDGTSSTAVCLADHTYGVCDCEPIPDLAVPIEDMAVPVDLAKPDLAMNPDMACAMVPSGKRVFVTSMTYKGDLKTAGAGTDGLDGGDKLCQARADAATLGGTWKAWLSSSTVDAIDRLADVGPWYQLDRCTMVFASKVAIVGGAPSNPLNRNELGATISGVSLWTGTQEDGRNDSDTCASWTDATNAVQGAVGTGAAGIFPGFWTSFIPAACDTSLRLLCFEQ